MSVLKRVIREHKIQMVYGGSQGTPYIQGSNGLYEFDGGPLSGWVYCAHLNPAVTLAMVTSKRMSLKKVPAYLTAQLFGAFFAGLVLYILFEPSIFAFETAHNIIRGAADSVQTAKMFGEYYLQSGSSAVVSMPLAMGAEAFGTFLRLCS